MLTRKRVQVRQRAPVELLGRSDRDRGRLLVPSGLRLERVLTKPDGLSRSLRSGLRMRASLRRRRLLRNQLTKPLAELGA